MKRYSTSLRVLPVAIFAVAATCAAAGRNAITPVQIANALSGSGMKVSADQVTLLSDVVATTSSPTLKLQSMQPWGDHRMKARLECATRAECMPFFVAVRWNTEPGAAVIPAASASTRPSIPSAVLRAGSPATLLIDGGHVHIRLSVVCLESGTLGQTIRVASKDRRVTYLAEVVDGAVLRATL